jgi:hypothetical protein
MKIVSIGIKIGLAICLLASGCGAGDTTVKNSGNLAPTRTHRPGSTSTRQQRLPTPTSSIPAAPAGSPIPNKIPVVTVMPPTQPGESLGLAPDQLFVIPATATPGLPSGNPTEPSGAPAGTPLTPEQIQALGELPVPVTAEGPAKQVEFLSLKTAQGDFYRNGEVETAQVFLEKSASADPAAMDGYLGLALYNAQNQLVWRSEPEVLKAVWHIEVRLEALQIEPGTVGLFYDRRLQWSGDAGQIDGRAGIYRWDGSAFQPVWMQTVATGANQGADLGEFVHQTLELKDVDGFGGKEILIQPDVYDRDLSSNHLKVHFQLFLPDALGLQWNGNTYELAFFDNQGVVTPAHPRQPVIYAPHFSKPLGAENSSAGWNQIEYWPALDFRNGGSNTQAWMRLGWDEQYLYISVTAQRGKDLTLGLDTDLTGDLPSNSLNGDDWVINFHSGPDACGPVQTTWVFPQEGGPDVQGTAYPTPDPGVCHLVLKMDLKGMKLDPAKLASKTGWVSGSQNPLEQRSYHPVADKVMGFAIQGDNLNLAEDFNMQDPTTWANLILMADR